MSSRLSVPETMRTPMRIPIIGELSFCSSGSVGGTVCCVGRVSGARVACVVSGTVGGWVVGTVGGSVAGWVVGGTVVSVGREVTWTSPSK